MQSRELLRFVFLFSCTSSIVIGACGWNAIAAVASKKKIRSLDGMSLNLFRGYFSPCQFSHSLGTLRAKREIKFHQLHNSSSAIRPLLINCLCKMWKCCTNNFEESWTRAQNYSVLKLYVYKPSPVAQLVSAWYLYDSIHRYITVEVMPRSRVRASPGELFSCKFDNNTFTHSHKWPQLELRKAGTSDVPVL